MLLVNCKNCNKETRKSFKTSDNETMCSVTCNKQYYENSTPFFSDQPLTYSVIKNNVTLIKPIKSYQRLYMICQHCEKIYIKKKIDVLSAMKRGIPNNFCSNKCNGDYGVENNRNYKSGSTNRSKLEVLLEDKLKSRYSNENILFNTRTQLDGLELDIFFEDRNFAIEINGAFHYHVVFKPEHLAMQQKNDQKKRDRCKEKGIRLYEVDVSKLRRVNESLARQYIEHVYQIIDTELNILSKS